MSSLPGSCTEGGRKHERTDNGPRGGRTLCRAWCANWRKVDIDAVVSHFAENAEMRSPLALKLTGPRWSQAPRNIRAYWQRAYGGIESTDLKILNWSWDDTIARLTVWWQLGDSRASEFMDFDGAGRVVRSEAFYGK